MTSEQKLVELEKALRKQDAKINQLIKQVALLERENARRRIEINGLQHVRSN